MLRALIRPVGIAAAMLLACLGLVLRSTPRPLPRAPASRGRLDQQVKRADVIFIGTIDNTSTAGDDQTYDITASRATRAPRSGRRRSSRPAATAPVVSRGGSASG